MNKRDQIPALLKQIDNLSDSVRQRVLREYPTISDTKVEKIYDFLVGQIARQEKQAKEEAASAQRKNQIYKNEINRIQEQEEITRAQELNHLLEIENELSNIIS